MLKSKNITPKIIEKAFKNKPLTDEQKENNRLKSRARSRVEHILWVYNKFNGRFFYAVDWFSAD
jgi:hypothetical protein